VLLLYGSEILSKNSAKLWFIFWKKNWDIWNLKFQQNSIVYYFILFFQHFCIFFSISTIQTCPKIMKFFAVIYWKGKRFYQRFLENSKSFFKKSINMWNIFFSKFCASLFLFLFFIIFDILFSISSICTCQKILEIFIFFLFYRLEILSKNFGKSWNIILKNIDIWNSKFFINSIVYYLFFLSF